MNIRKGKINVSVANIYRESTYRSEVISQALLGEEIEIIKRKNDFTLVQLPDKYEGWISNYQWVADQQVTIMTKIVRSHFQPIYELPNFDSPRVRDAVIGTLLPFTEIDNGWVSVILPDGINGWVDEKAFGDFPPTNRMGAAQLAQEFLGYPYYWGGRSTKGFDCSGLTQMILALLRINIPRDSWMQHRDGKFVSDKPEDAKAGDLYFFAEGGAKITHVGIATGNGRLIHARGMVKINSLISTDTNCDQTLQKSFVDVRTYFDQ